MEIIGVITFRLLLIFPEISGKFHQISGKFTTLLPTPVQEGDSGCGELPEEHGPLTGLVSLVVAL